MQREIYVSRGQYSFRFDVMAKCCVLTAAEAPLSVALSLLKRLIEIFTGFYVTS
jgi:hypothetical protein